MKDVKCRACWKNKKKVISELVTTNLTSIEPKKTIKEIFLLCVPWMTIKDEHYICKPCVWELRYTYGFIQKCLEAENSFNGDNQKREIDMEDLHRNALQAKIIFNNTVGTQVKVEPVIVSENSNDTSNIDLPVKPVVVNENSDDTSNIDLPVKPVVVNENSDDTSIIDLPIETVNDKMRSQLINDGIGRLFEASVESDTFNKTNNTKSKKTKKNLTNPNIFLRTKELVPDPDLPEPLLKELKDVLDIVPVDMLFVTAQTDISVEQQGDLAGDGINFFNMSKDPSKKKRVIFFGRDLCRGKYPCNQCNTMFYSSSDYVDHLRLHRRGKITIDGAPLFTCDICKATFAYDIDFRAHTDVHHQIRNPHKCERCQKRFRGHKSLKDHLKMFENKKKCGFICSRCDKSFKTMKAFVQHEENARDAPCCNYKQCETCLEKFTIQDFKTHCNTVHINYLCKECDKSFPTRESLWSHNRTHTLNNSMCHECGKILGSNQYLERHMKSVHAEKKIPCDKCSRTFTTDGHLNKHIKNVHSGPNTKKLFICEKCANACSTKSALRYHIRMFHVYESKHTCPLCNEGFFRKDYLKRHLKYHDTYASNTCRICKRSFKTRGFLDRHMTFGHDEKGNSLQPCRRSFTNKLGVTSTKTKKKYKARYTPTICKLCKKIFSNRNSLQLHYMSHLNVRKFKCEKCGISFQSSSSLARHHKTKHENPHAEFSCNICYAHKSSSKDLKNHMLKVHKYKKYKCKYCSEAFGRNYLLYDHETTVHKEENDKKALLLEMLYEGGVRASNEDLLAYKRTHGGKVARIGSVTVVNQLTEEN